MPVIHRIGYVPGVYDLFHVGHLNLLRQARRHCEYLVAGVVSDDLVRERKGFTPVVPEHERLDIVSSLNLVDKGILEAVPSKTEVWEQVHFDAIFKGDDWQGTPAGDALEQLFEPLGVEIVYLPYTLHTSSTVLRRALDLLDRSAAPAPAQLPMGQVTP
ncbi:adenylyltransferase/cytidyltransferase family protein [Arthrobacter woluwensis]|uniref:adenylyltransferase/cytidyltransferase family protein n=1 Tax=Arthrobacter woluwensis TaxID=156980 RepID=UPI0011A6BB7A|nr:adenylyltransferase/cytidyltransferase family protein [Arthrobacter woluwensis]